MILRSAAVMRPDSAPTRRQHDGPGCFAAAEFEIFRPRRSVAGEHRISEAYAMSINVSGWMSRAAEKGCMTAASTDWLHEPPDTMSNNLLS